MAEDEAEDEKETQSWYLSLPKLLAAVGGVIIAITGLVGGLNAAGLLGGNDSVTTATPSPSSTTTIPPRLPDTDSGGFLAYPFARCPLKVPPRPWLSPPSRRW